MPELLNDDIATLLRERLDARQPRRLPLRFVPPAERPHRVRWAIAVAAAFLLGLAIATLLQPGVGQIVRSGLLDRPGATPAPTVTAPGRRPDVTQAPGVAPAPSASPSQTPAPQPSGADGSGSGSSAGGTPPPPPPAGDTITLPLPPLPLPTPSGGVPLPVPSLPLPPLPLPTPSGGGLPPLLPTPH